MLSAIFYHNLAAGFQQLATYSCPVVICGDFNIHVDQIDDPNTVRLQQLLKLFGYVQHITEQTHTVGHTLDLVITRSESDIVGVRASSHPFHRVDMCVSRSVRLFDDVLIISKPA